MWSSSVCGGESVPQGLYVLYRSQFTRDIRIQTGPAAHIARNPLSIARRNITSAPCRGKRSPHNADVFTGRRVHPLALDRLCRAQDSRVFLLPVRSLKSQRPGIPSQLDTTLARQQPSRSREPCATTRHTSFRLSLCGELATGGWSGFGPA
ncbi:hypothetical protein CERSUDRAFT_120265 [Gelatoporia subvermispora B]|uniref:Uncharacterized protein n=1 Tax=Ceriporiopsis subvermispora (strain B) TaxID=914234 RepID=M2Q240_CERS8|nr:hypothetical protein CERSUDRAFT_120265 [Gelatoporia subvermispora B]